MPELLVDTITNLVCFAAAILTILGVGYKILQWTKRIDSRLEKVNNKVEEHSLVLKTIVDVFVELRKRLLNRETITMDVVINTISEASEKVLSSVIAAYFSTHSEKSGNPSTYQERRKKELLEKARQRKITYGEGQELQKLLEEQKRQHEASGDIGGAILAGLLLLFLLGILAALFGEKRKD